MRSAKWKPAVLLSGSTQAASPAAAKLPTAAQPVVVASMLEYTRRQMHSARYDVTEPRRAIGRARSSANGPLSESVQLTSDGRRRHTLQRTSPGGTMRASAYTSPNRADVLMDIGDNHWSDEDIDDELEMEQWRRRGVAVEEVACQQSNAQRSAASRKRKAAASSSAHYPPRWRAGDLDDGRVLGQVASALFALWR